MKRATLTADNPEVVNPNGAPAADRPGPCRCHEVPRLTGGEAVRYACGHLLAVRRWPRAGRFALVCPTTRVAWLAHDEWADRSGEATLIRLAALPDPLRPTRTDPSPGPGR